MMQPRHSPLPGSRAPGRLFARRLVLPAAALIAIAAVVIQSLASTERPLAVLPTPPPTPTTLMRIDPPSQSVSPGTNVVVNILVDNVTNMAAFEFELHYYGSTLGFVSVTNGPFLGSTGLSPFCLPPQLDVGKVRYGCVTSGIGTPVTGSGLLATVTLSTSCGGTTPLDFKLVGLSDTLGNGLATRSQGGSATVASGAPCPTPTPTTRPTSTPTVAPTAPPTPAGLIGDANCDRSVNSIDAAVVLQYVAGLLHSLQCSALANANHDATVNSVDSALILQYVAGLVSHL